MTSKSGTPKARTLQGLRKVCKPSPLEGSELKTFFVETDAARDPRQKPRLRLHDDLEKEPARLLFYGHQGCGKSTELNKFLDEYKDEFLPVKFSVLDAMTPSNALAEDLILVITERVLETAKQNKIKVSDSVLKEVYKYFAETTKTQTKGHGGEMKASTGLDTTPTYLGKLLGLFAGFSGEIRMNSYSEETAIHVLRKRPAELLTQANRVIEVVRTGLTDRKLLIIVEDMDKLDLKQARDIYVNNVNLLTGLSAHVIYTIPIYLFHSPDLGAFRPRFDDAVALPMIKVWDPETGKAPGFETVRQIVLERVEEALFGKGALDLLVEKTGGVLRHAFEVLHIVATMQSPDQKITTERVRYGLDQLRKECLQQISLPSDPMPDGPKSVNDLFDRLTEYAKKQRKGEKQIPVSDATNQILLKTCALVEYNGEGWFGVHPLIVESLERLGRLADHAS